MKLHNSPSHATLGLTSDMSARTPMVVLNTGVYRDWIGGYS